MSNWVKSFLQDNPDKATWPVFKRAKYSIHLRRPDGKIEANFTGAPMHFQDILGEWHPLDTKLIAIGSELGAPGLPTRIALDGTVRIEEGEDEMSDTEQFVRGMLYGLPISLFLWVGIIYGIVRLF